MSSCQRTNPGNLSLQCHNVAKLRYYDLFPLHNIRTIVLWLVFPWTTGNFRYLYKIILCTWAPGDSREPADTLGHLHYITPVSKSTSRERHCITKMQRLSEFGQASLRSYQQIVLAFPLAETASAPTIYQHLRSSLTRVGNECPLLACNVNLQKSRFGEEVFILPSSEGIPLQTEIDNSSYADLAASGFPAAHFIHPGSDLNDSLKLDGGPAPVAHARVKFINGGLLLFLSLHHSAGDGYCLGLFAEAFAAATRGGWIAVEYFSLVLKLPQDEDISSATLLTLSNQCPEYEVLLDPNILLFYNLNFNFK